MKQSKSKKKYNPNLGFIGNSEVKVSNYLFSKKRLRTAYQHAKPIADRLLTKEVSNHYNESKKLTRFLKNRDLTFSKKTASGEYKTFTVPCTTTIVPLQKSLFNDVERAAQKLVPYNEDLSISDTTADFYQKLGNRTDIGLSVDMFMSDWFKFTPQYMITSTEKAQYFSPDERANELLAQNTDSYSQSLRLQGQLTSVRLYGQNKFVAPGLINVAYQTMLEGRNTPKVDLIEVEFRMYF